MHFQRAKWGNKTENELLRHFWKKQGSQKMCFVANLNLDQIMVSKRTTTTNKNKKTRTQQPKQWKQVETGEVWGRDLERKKQNNKKQKAK